MVVEAQKGLDAEAGIERAGGGADAMHAELRDADVDGADTGVGAEHGTDGAAAAAVVADLEDLDAAARLLGDAVEERGRDGVGGHVAVRVG